MAVVIQKMLQIISEVRGGSSRVLAGIWLCEYISVKFLILDSVSPTGYEKVFCTLVPRAL